MLYLHETVDVRPAQADEFGPRLAEIYRPAMERAMDDWTQKMHNFQLAHVAEADHCWDVVQKDDSPEQLTQEAIQSASEIQKGGTIISLEFLRKVMLELTPAQRMKLIERIRSGFKF